MPGLPLLAPTAFVLATLMLYWARWPHTGEIVLLLLVPIPIYLYYQGRHGWPDAARNLRGAAWLIAYFATIAALSWAGSVEFEGHGYLAYGWDQLCVAVAALVFYSWGLASGWVTPWIAARHRG